MNHTVKPLSNWDSSPRHWAGKEEVQFPIQEIEPGKTFCSHYQNRILFDFVAHEARALTCNGWMWCQCTSCKVFRLDQWDRVAKTIFSVWKKKNEGVQNVAATTCLSLCLSPRKSCPSSVASEGVLPRSSGFCKSHLWFWRETQTFKSASSTM